MKRNYKKADNRSKGQKIITGFIAISSFILLLFGLGGMQNWDNFYGLIISLVALGGLYYAAYSAGWLYEQFYEEDEE